MGFDWQRYNEMKETVETAIEKGRVTPAEYMKDYKKCIVNEDYEKAKAITDVIRPLNFYTEDTHVHIDELWN